jgi:hypothetical protein
MDAGECAAPPLLCCPLPRRVHPGEQHSRADRGLIGRADRVGVESRQPADLAPRPIGAAFVRGGVARAAQLVMVAVASSCSTLQQPYFRRPRLPVDLFSIEDFEVRRQRQVVRE